MKRRELVYIGGALATWVALYLVGTLGISAAFSCYPHIDTFSWICGHQYRVLPFITAIVPAYFVGFMIGRAGLLYGALVAVSGWLIVEVADSLVRPRPFNLDIWDVFSSYIVIGALAGGVGQLHRRSKGNREL